MSGLEERFTTHWFEGVEWCLFLLSNKASNLSFCLSLAVSDSNWLWLRQITLKLRSAGAAGQTLTRVVERISRFQAGRSYSSNPGCVHLRTCGQYSLQSYGLLLS